MDVSMIKFIINFSISILCRQPRQSLKNYKWRARQNNKCKTDIAVKGTQFKI